MEVEIFQILEFTGGGAEQLLDLCDVGVHRTANIEEHQQLDRVAALGAQLDIEEARVLCRAVDGIVDIKLIGRALAGKAAQAAQCDLDVAGANLPVRIQILELAAIPDFDRGIVAVLGLPDPHAFRVIAVGAKGAGPGGPDVLVAALVALFLIFEALAQSLHYLIKATQSLNLRLFLVGEGLFGNLAQPFFGDFAKDFFEAGDPVPKVLKGPIEAIKMGFVLDQRSPRQRIEVVQIGVHDARFQRADQIQ